MWGGSFSGGAGRRGLWPLLRHELQVPDSQMSTSKLCQGSLFQQRAAATLRCSKRGLCSSISQLAAGSVDPTHDHMQSDLSICHCISSSGQLITHNNAGASITADMHRTPGAEAALLLSSEK